MTDESVKTKKQLIELVERAYRERLIEKAAITGSNGDDRVQFVISVPKQLKKDLFDFASEVMP